MAKTTNQIDKIVRRNQREKARIMKLLDAEGVEEKGAAEVLQNLTQNGFPQTMEGLLRLLVPLKKYGLPVVGSSVYPDPPSPIPLDWKKLGMRWSFTFPNGQSIAVVIANDGKTVIKRFYEDNGDILIGEVIKTLKAWQKSIEQQQHGGRKSDPVLLGLFQEWQATNFDPKQKAVFRQKYTIDQKDKSLASKQFDQAMKRYKKKFKSFLGE